MMMKKNNNNSNDNQQYQVEDNQQAKCVCKDQQNVEGDETVSHIVSECRKLAQKQFILILEAQQGGADDSLGPLWKAGLWQE